MKKIENLISYFCEYEMYNSLLANSISDKGARDVVLDQCSFSSFSDKMQAHKCDKIWYSLKGKLTAANADADRASIRGYVTGAVTLDRLFDTLSFADSKQPYDAKSNVNATCNEQHFCVYYPVMLARNKKTQQPMLSFSCQLLASSFQIDKAYANKEAFALLIAQHNDLELVDARSLYDEQLDALVAAVDALHPSDNFHDIYQVVCGECKRLIDTSPDEFVNTADWQMLDKAVVSFEPLSSSIDSCFRDEMNSLVKFYKEDAIVPTTVERYLGLSHDEAKEITDIAFAASHGGSYQSAYPVNRRQWELVQLATTADLLCVEGPPGTGKTTFLKEIIADTLVKKADRLLETWENGWQDVGEAGKTINCSPLGGENLNSVVIGSTNGKAIDNIGLELLAEVPYFADFAKNISATKGEYSRCSGILCARLGKSENIEHFYNAIFAPFCKYLASREIADDEVDLAKANYTELRGKLNEANASIANIITLREQEPQLAGVAAIDEELSRLDAELGVLADLQGLAGNNKMKCDKELAQVRFGIVGIQQEILRQGQLLQGLEEAQRAFYSDLEEYEQIGTIKKCLHFLFPAADRLLQKYGSAQQIRDIIQEIKAKIDNCKVQIDTASQSLVIAKETLAKTEYAIVGLVEDLTEATAKLSTTTHCRATLARHRDQLATLGGQIGCPEDDLLRLEPYDMCNTQATIALRHDIFVAANRLIEAYIVTNKEPILQNLSLVLEEVSYGGRSSFRWCRVLYNGDKAYRSDRAARVRALWETFFLCFPVVTATLHSLHQGTFPLIPGLFDQLLIDESGQVVPYYVVAPLYRARRAIFVGDTNQIEPIKSVPAGLLEAKYVELLGREAYDSYCIDTASAQGFAALASNYCERNQAQVSGIILNEHRRCEPAIMAFSNQHIYHNVLVLKGANDCAKLFGSNLVAFDIRGSKAFQHYNQSEIDACKSVVDLYVQEYGEGVRERIGIITPFRQQATRLRTAIPEVEAGTVHLFQGAEKDYIIFSGVVDDTAVNGGLGRFVGGKGNLLNVAFSRAKKQFVYIGNLGAARAAGNYLSMAVESIQDNGLVFSLFDTGNGMASLDAGIAHVLVGKRAVYGTDAIYAYLQSVIPQSIIDTPKLHNEILLSVLQLAAHSIHIISPWIGGNVVNAEMLGIIGERMGQGLEIKVTFGYRATQCSLGDIDELALQDVPWSHELAATAIRGLYALLGDNLRYAPPSHIKLLLVDDKYLFIGSLNWLFNGGKSEQKEISCLITSPDTIDYVKRIVMGG